MDGPDRAISSVMITLTLVAIFASVIFNTAKLATDINNVPRLVYVRKDVEDNSETIVKRKAKQSQCDYHKVYNVKLCQPLKM